MTSNITRIGSISHGTMRPEDLIPCFMDALDSIREDLSSGGPENVATVSRIDDFLGEIEHNMNVEIDFDSDEPGYFDGDECMEDLSALEDMLNEFAPPYCYFGSHPGDGADYGFWPMMDSLEEDALNGDVLKINAGDEWPEDEIRERVEMDCISYVLEVNDHGNVTLYTTDHKEVWSCV